MIMMMMMIQLNISIHTVQEYVRVILEHRMICKFQYKAGFRYGQTPLFALVNNGR